MEKQIIEFEADLADNIEAVVALESVVERYREYQGDDESAAFEFWQSRIDVLERLTDAIRKARWS